MRDRRAHLSERAHARDVGEGSLGDLQCLLRPPGCSDIHQCTDQFLLARFVDLTMRSNVNVFDVSIGHQQTVLIVVVLLASYRAIELLLHELAILGVNALQEQSRKMYGDNSRASQDLWAQFMNLQGPAMQSLMQAYMEQSQKMFAQFQDQMQNQARNMFSGLSFPGFPAGGKDKSEDKS